MACSAKTAWPSFPHRLKIPEAKGPSLAQARESLSWPQGVGLSPPHPAWEAGGTRAPAVGTQGFQTRQTCSPHLGGPATPCPKPSGQPNQPGQVWAGMPGAAVTALHPQPARLPTTSVPSVPGKCITSSGSAVCRIWALASSAEVSLSGIRKSDLIYLSWEHPSSGTKSSSAKSSQQLEKAPGGWRRQSVGALWGEDAWIRAD